jgi:hypothetical protein
MLAPSKTCRQLVGLKPTALAGTSGVHDLLVLVRSVILSSERCASGAVRYPSTLQLHMYEGKARGGGVTERRNYLVLAKHQVGGSCQPPFLCCDQQHMTFS